MLVLFTDGEDSRSALSLREVLKLVRSSAVTIYPIAFTAASAGASRARLRPRAVLSSWPT